MHFTPTSLRRTDFRRYSSSCPIGITDTIGSVAHRRPHRRSIGRHDRPSAASLGNPHELGDSRPGRDRLVGLPDVHARGPRRRAPRRGVGRTRPGRRDRLEAAAAAKSAGGDLRLSPLRAILSVRANRSEDRQGSADEVAERERPERQGRREGQERQRQGQERREERQRRQGKEGYEGRRGEGRHEDGRRQEGRREEG